MATQASFGDMPVRDFVAALSAKQPTPGGGAAAAALRARNAALEADLQRAREDATFVLSQLDKAEAENERLQAELVRVTDILAAREAELLAAKGLDSPEDETF